MNRLLLIITFILFFLNTAHSADQNIDMLNKSGREINVYSKKIVNVEVGDTVFWKSASKGHNVEFISKRGVPEGVGKFKSKVSKDAQFTFEVPGIYAYWCTPHKAMGMIGFVVVGGNTDNIESIKKVKWVGKKSKKIAKELISKIEAG